MDSDFIETEKTDQEYAAEASQREHETEEAESLVPQLDWILQTLRSECQKETCPLCPFIRIWRKTYPNEPLPSSMYDSIHSRLQEYAVQKCAELAKATSEEFDADDLPFIFMRYLNVYEAVHKPYFSIVSLQLLNNCLKEVKGQREEDETFHFIQSRVKRIVSQTSMEEGDFAFVILIEETLPWESSLSSSSSSVCNVTVSKMNKFTLHRRIVHLTSKYSKDPQFDLEKQLHLFSPSLNDMLHSILKEKSKQS